MCIIGAPLLFFILGLIALLTGMEKKPQPPSSQPIVIQQPIQPPSQQVVIQQPMNEDAKIKETGGDGFMYNRNDLIFGIIFIGIGIIFFISLLWAEPITNRVEYPAWFFLIFRIIALVCVVAGIIGIIAALIPRKQR